MKKTLTIIAAVAALGALAFAALDLAEMFMDLFAEKEVQLSEEEAEEIFQETKDLSYA